MFFCADLPRREGDFRRLSEGRETHVLLRLRCVGPALRAFRLRLPVLAPGIQPAHVGRRIEKCAVRGRVHPSEPVVWARKLHPKMRLHELSVSGRIHQRGMDPRMAVRIDKRRPSLRMCQIQVHRRFAGGHPRGRIVPVLDWTVRLNASHPGGRIERIERRSRCPFGLL